MNLVTLTGVSKGFGERMLFEDIDLSVNQGDRIGLIGVNGSGKSTLLHVVAGLEPVDAGTVATWGGVRVELLEQDPELPSGESVLDYCLGADDPGARLLLEHRRVTERLGASPAEAGLIDRLAELSLAMERAGAWAADVRVRTMLSRLGIADPAAPLETLSGGQRKRAALARALLEPADLLILDEPTNHLDADAVAWLEEYIGKVPGALLLVTHDRYFLDRVANRILELDRRALVAYPGNYSRYLELCMERQERLGAMETHRRKLLRRELAWLRRAPQARSTKQKARAKRVEELARLEYDSGEKVVEIPLGGRRLGQRVLTATGLAKAFGSTAVLSGLDLELGPGERLGIIGPNGAGKTTLLDVLAGRLAPDSGTVVWGSSVELGYFDQATVGLEEDAKVIDWLEERAPLVSTKDGARVTAARMLEWFLFEGRQQHGRIASLSGGERRRLYLLATLVGRPNVLFMDEPTNDLDVPTLTVLEEFLDSFRGTLVVVSHDRYFLDRNVDELVCLEGGRLVDRYPTPYDVYIRLRDEARAKAQADNAPARPTGAGARSGKAERGGQARLRPAGEPRRSAWRQRRELGELEEHIAALEGEKATLVEAMKAAATDYLELGRLAEGLGEVDRELDEAVARWLALAEERGEDGGSSGR